MGISLVLLTKAHHDARFKQRKDRQCTYNLTAFSSNHFCTGESINISHSECVFVALGIQHAMLMHHIVICGLTGSTIFF